MRRVENALSIPPVHVDWRGKEGVRGEEEMISIRR